MWETPATIQLRSLGWWIKVLAVGAVKINPVTYVMQAMRAMTLGDWDWPAILTGGLVALLMMGVLLAATTWMHSGRRRRGRFLAPASWVLSGMSFSLPFVWSVNSLG